MSIEVVDGELVKEDYERLYDDAFSYISKARQTGEDGGLTYEPPCGTPIKSTSSCCTKMTDIYAARVLISLQR